jgi:hypothetical protein
MNGCTSKAIAKSQDQDADVPHYVSDVCAGGGKVYAGGTQINLAIAASLSDTRRLAFSFLASAHAANQ